MEKGYIQIYTGNGKGKTTAALGLALRACGHGMSVFIAQFVKGMKYGELDALQRFSDNVTIKQYGRDCFIHKEPEDEDRRVAKQGWREVQEIISSNGADILILDELGIAIYYGLITIEEVLELISKKPVEMEIVITGRKVPEELFEVADLVTEMREIKHYYQQNVSAREGIEF
jgi:cob(I)alamin adenosyltransferase